MVVTVKVYLELLKVVQYSIRQSLMSYPIFKITHLRAGACWVLSRQETERMGLSCFPEVQVLSAILVCSFHQQLNNSCEIQH